MHASKYACASATQNAWQSYDVKADAVPLSAWLLFRDAFQGRPLRSLLG